jgi:hypothetical protein
MYFKHLWSDLDNVLYKFPKNLGNSVSFMQISSVKSVVRVLYIMLLSICEFYEKQPRESHTFLMGINEIACTCVPWNCMTFCV